MLHKSYNWSNKKKTETKIEEKQRRKKWVWITAFQRSRPYFVSRFFSFSSHSHRLEFLSRICVKLLNRKWPLFCVCEKKKSMEKYRIVFVVWAQRIKSEIEFRRSTDSIILQILASNICIFANSKKWKKERKRIHLKIMNYLLTDNWLNAIDKLR